MVGESNQNVLLTHTDASSFAEFEISEFEISRFDCTCSLHASSVGHSDQCRLPEEVNSSWHLYVNTVEVIV